MKMLVIGDLICQWAVLRAARFPNLLFGGVLPSKF
jgi:hypothetical protein